jgi:hypothetical protein
MPNLKEFLAKQEELHADPAELTFWETISELAD